MKVALFLIATGATLGAVRCGPTFVEAGASVSMMAPLAFAASLGIHWLLWKMWCRFRPGLVFRFRPGLIVVGILTLASLAVLAFGPSPGKWVAQALWLFSASLMAIQLLVLRLWLEVAPREAFLWAPILPAVLFTLPAWGFTLGGDRSEFGGLGLIMWVLPGYGGTITGGILLLLVIEALVRGRRARRSHPPSDVERPR